MNIFVVPSAHLYFTELANAISYHLPVSVVSQQYDNTKTNVILGSHLLRRNLDMRKDTIFINMEQLYHGMRWLTRDYIDNMKQYTVWDYNETNIEWLKDKYGIAAKLFTISFPLVQIQNDNKDIDILFYGNMSVRRRRIINDIRKEHNVHVVNNVWGEKLNSLISRSKIVLNIHFYNERKAFEVCRILSAIAMNAFVISETCEMVTSAYSHVPIVYCDDVDFGKTIEFYLNNECEREAMRLLQYNTEINVHIPL